MDGDGVDEWFERYLEEPASVRRFPLRCDYSPADVLRLLRGERLPFGLIGKWAGGGAILGFDPLVVASDAADGFRPVDRLPKFRDGQTGIVGGGWFGYLGYQLGRLVEDLPPPPLASSNTLPDIFMAFHNSILRYDDAANQWWFECLWTESRSADLESRLAHVEQLTQTRMARDGTFASGPYSLMPDAGTHIKSVRTAVDQIWAGEVFQVNLCLHLEADYSGDPLDAFCCGVERLDPLYAAFFRLGDRSAIASFSPELFLRRHGREILTSPIKGTSTRVAEEESSCRERALLETSDKNRAENVMIVDLMRNDLSRVCRPGTVTVPELIRSEPHPGLWHLVSDVTGTLQPDASDSAVLRATFPPGSITGAPKVRAMEIINELECSSRVVYTGAIGLFSPTLGMELNVAIRTFEFDGDRVSLGAGGGIVAGSDPAQEFQECLSKCRPLIEVMSGDGGDATIHDSSSFAATQMRPCPAQGIFETMQAVDGHVAMFERHLNRLRLGAREVYGHGLRSEQLESIRTSVAALARTRRVRITVRPRASELRIEIESHINSQKPLESVRVTPVVLRGGIGEYKWRDRRIIEKLREIKGVTEGDRLLFVEPGGTVLEAEHGNVFCVRNGTLRTPLLDGRILPGVSRGRVLDAARDCGVEFEETTLNLDDLLEADEVFLTNALRGIQPAIVLSNLQETHTKQAAGRITSILHDALQVERLDSVRSFSRAGVQPTADCEQVYPRNTDLSRIVVIDNYDSFTYNLVHYLERMGIPVTVFRNSAVEIARLVETRPLAIVLSPGPCSPTEAGMCNEIVARMGETVPILGVCLGHQCIAQSFGARIARSPVPVHGRASRISHDGKGIFRGLPNCIDGARYHSLTVDPLSLPPVLEPTSWTDDGVLMGIRHAVKPIEGIQFHPESILTEQGYRMLENFIEGARTWSTEASVRNSAPRRPIATRS